MGWFSKNILAKLGLDSGSDEDRLIDQLEQIRAAMLESLGDAGAEKYPLVVRRVFHSKNAQALWYARAELQLRSEERRVGKECRSRWSPYH